MAIHHGPPIPGFRCSRLDTGGTPCDYALLYPGSPYGLPDHVCSEVMWELTRQFAYHYGEGVHHQDFVEWSHEWPLPVGAQSIAGYLDDWEAQFPGFPLPPTPEPLVPDVPDALIGLAISRKVGPVRVALLGLVTPLDHFAIGALPEGAPFKTREEAEAVREGATKILAAYLGAVLPAPKSPAEAVTVLRNAPADVRTAREHVEMAEDALHGPYLYRFGEPRLHYLGTVPTARVNEKRQQEDALLTWYRAAVLGQVARATGGGRPTGPGPWYPWVQQLYWSLAKETGDPPTQREVLDLAYKQGIKVSERTLNNYWRQITKPPDESVRQALRDILQPNAPTSSASTAGDS